VSSYRLPVVTFLLSLRVSEILGLPLFCPSMPLFPHPASIVSSKFPHVPLGTGLLDTKSKGVGLIVRAVSKVSNLCDHNPPTSQTDGRTTCDRNTARCGKNWPVRL